MIPEPLDHGGDGARLARALGVAPDEVLDLSASLNPVAPDIAPLVRHHAGAARRYPDPAGATFALAETLGIDPDRVVLTNGGAEAIALVAACRPSGWIDEPEFSLYARHLARVEPGAPRWRSNPHNPTGRLAAAAERAAVWDEAFYPLTAGRWTRGDADDGAIVVGSLTKVFACPGLRVGYLVAPDGAVADEIRRRRPQWSVNAIACAALPELLAAADLPAWSAAVARLRAQLTAVLCDHGFVPEPSDANFVLVRHAPALRNELARHGVLVRDTASFGIPGGVRIAVPDEQGCNRVADALGGRR